MDNILKRYQRTLNDTEYSGIKRISLQYCRVGRHNVRVCVTIFPDTGHYSMVFTSKMPKVNLTLEIIKNLIEETL